MKPYPDEFLYIIGERVYEPMEGRGFDMLKSSVIRTIIVILQDRVRQGGQLDLKLDEVSILEILDLYHTCIILFSVIHKKHFFSFKK